MFVLGRRGVIKLLSMQSELMRSPRTGAAKDKEDGEISAPGPHLGAALGSGAGSDGAGRMDVSEQLRSTLSGRLARRDGTAHCRPR